MKIYDGHTQKRHLNSFFQVKSIFNPTETVEPFLNSRANKKGFGKVSVPLKELTESIILTRQRETTDVNINNCGSEESKGSVKELLGWLINGRGYNWETLVGHKNHFNATSPANKRVSVTHN